MMVVLQVCSMQIILPRFRPLSPPRPSRSSTSSPTTRNIWNWGTLVAVLCICSSQIVAKISTRVQQLDVRMETKVRLFCSTTGIQVQIEGRCSIFLVSCRGTIWLAVAGSLSPRLQILTRIVVRPGIMYSR